MPSDEIELGDTITLDISDLLGNRDLTPPQQQALTAAMSRAAAYIRDTWIAAVSGTPLPGMARSVHDAAYANALRDPSAIRAISATRIEIDPAYSGAERIESGYPSFDQKPGLLSGPAARITRTGDTIHRYTRIPVGRFQAPGPDMPGLPALPLDIYRSVQASGVYHDAGNAILGEQQGQRSTVPLAVNLQAITRGLPPPMLRPYTWRSGLYAGLRPDASQRIGDRPSYRTWRTVSDTSDPYSWIHPGLPANHVRAAVLQATQDGVETILQDALSEIVSG